MKRVKITTINPLIEGEIVNTYVNGIIDDENWKIIAYDQNGNAEEYINMHSIHFRSASYED
ncbi:hypothetical protein LI82_02680 [Methanococcoides methylutens]|uniref:Uncharacterized protein n=1 Tax=Methanococcoides methylutens TaxID=2226 RepID=A0A099T1B8_METMT|nr:hypothetical protein [Methanococcoides methylutens]KGK98965.1 hypothetical protein LI82_02680 [Methanococcoides methylutens]